MPNTENLQQNQFDDHAEINLLEGNADVAEQAIGVAYQYALHIDGLTPQCPPAIAMESNKDCWRYTFNPISDTCFWPPKRKNPVRVASSTEQECSMWALSMYESEHQAVNAYVKLSRSFKNIKKVLGDHLSAGAVTCNDGKCMPANGHGHFDFHPYMHATYSNNFNIIRALP